MTTGQAFRRAKELEEQAERVLERLQLAYERNDVAAINELTHEHHALMAQARGFYRVAAEASG